MVPNKFGPTGQIVPKIFHSSWTGYGDPEIRGPNWLGTICPWGPNLMGTSCMGIWIVCPGGQEVGDWKSRDQMGSGPNASQPKKMIRNSHLSI